MIADRLWFARQGRPWTMALVLALVVAACGGGGGGDDVADGGGDPAPVESVTPIDLDPAVTVGTLDNGLTYYLRHNERPGGRVAMRLVVDAGALDEPEEFRGLAHYLEHMAFNGTDAYPGGRVVTVLGELGSQIGPHLNAHTTLEETVYALDLSADDETVDTGLEVMAQWASAMTLTPEEVEAERGVVIEEWRSGEAPAARAWEAFNEAFLVGTNAEGRDTIGELETLRAIDAAALRDYYEAHYRPDRMAVVVVGDIDVDDIEDRIGAVFGGLTGSGVARPDDAPAPWGDVRATSFTDDALPSSWVAVAAPATPNRLATEEDWVRSWQLGAALDVLANRLSDDIGRGDLPYVDSFSLWGAATRDIDRYVLGIEARADQLTDAGEAVLTEIERALRHGVSAAEVDRLTTEYQNLIDGRLEEFGSTQDREHADQLVGHHLTGRALPTAKEEADIDSEIVAGIDAAFVEAGLQELFGGETGLLIGVAGADAAATPDEEALLALVEDVRGRDVDARAADAVVAADGFGTFDDVASMTDWDDGSLDGSKRVEYPNGVEVVLFPSTISEGRVLIRGASFGGLGRVADRDVTAGDVLGSLLAGSGIGDYDRVELDQVLADRDVSLQFGLTHTRDVVFAEGASEDVDVLAQMLHASMRSPRVDDAALRRLIDELLPRASNPSNFFDDAPWDAYSRLRSGGDIRFRYLPPPAELTALTAADAQRLASERFGDAGGWVFAVVGDLSINEMIDLSNRYLGTLPSSGQAESWTDVGRPFPAGDLRERVSVAGAQAAVVHARGAAVEDTLRDDMLVDVLRELIENRLFATIREELGATYSPFVLPQISAEPRRELELLIYSAGEPERIDELAAAIRSELNDLGANGPTDGELAAARAQLRTDYDLYSNEFYADRILEYRLHPTRSANELYSRSSLIPDLPRSDIEQFLRRVLVDGGTIEVVVSP